MSTVKKNIVIVRLANKISGNMPESIQTLREGGLPIGKCSKIIEDGIRWI